MRRPLLAAHEQIERHAVIAANGIDIAHRNRSAHGRPEAARRHLADALAGLAENLGPFAGRRLAVGAKADALARRAIEELLHDAGRARKIARHLAPLADGPGEPGLD